MAARRPRIDIASILKLTEIADYIIPFTIRAVCELGVADHLAAGPQSIEFIAQATKAHAPSLYRAMRALACKEIFVEVEPGHFGLTPMAEYLRSDHPLSLKDAYSLIPSELEAWAHLDFTVRSGQPAFPAVHGCDFWDYMSKHPEEAERFHRSQQAHTRLELAVFLRTRNWAEAGTIVDVGGGNGAFLSGLLARTEGTRGILFDLPDAVNDAQRVVAEHGVADRCKIVRGDFFAGVPSGGDAYTLKRILYGWHDEEALRILQTVRAAMLPSSRLFIMEPSIESVGTSALSRRLDLSMLVMKGCGARSLPQLKEMCSAADLQVVAVDDNYLYPIIEVAVRSG